MMNFMSVSGMVLGPSSPVVLVGASTSDILSGMDWLRRATEKGSWRRIDVKLSRDEYDIWRGESVWWRCWSEGDVGGWFIVDTMPHFDHQIEHCNIHFHSERHSSPHSWLPDAPRTEVVRLVTFSFIWWFLWKAHMRSTPPYELFWTTYLIAVLHSFVIVCGCFSQSTSPPYHAL